MSGHFLKSSFCLADKKLVAVVIALVVGLAIYLGFLHPEEAIPFEKATRDHPWVNSLGMKFVPEAGTQGLFCIWDTPVQDFELPSCR